MSAEAIVIATAALLGMFVWVSRRELRRSAEKNPHAAALPGSDEEDQGDGRPASGSARPA